MPIFLDQRAGGIPAETVGAVTEKVASGKTDESGAKALNVIWSDSETWCLSEAPSAEVVHKAHEAIGITLGEGTIREVQKIV